MPTITSPSWWKAAAIRALRTAIFVAIPFVPTVFESQNYLILLSAAGFAAVSSFLTSLFKIPEVEGVTVSWYWAVLERTTKTAAQALLTVFGTATLFSEVDWSLALPAMGTAVLGSLLSSILVALPETEDTAESTV